VKTPEPKNDEKRTRGKIVSIEELAVITRALKQSGKKVVQAHGAFDLLHLGHVKHLESARSNGDALIVTITGDKYINKGPNRPVFHEYLRAEMLAALEIVDYVAINQHLDAVSAIKTIRPNFYAKGQDYVNAQGDVTGKITEERNAIESVGGSIVFTDEVTFSSTELINRNLNIYEPQIRSCLDSMRASNGLEEALRVIESVKDYSVLLVGDAIIDEYQYVIAMGKPPKEYLIATRYQNYEQFAGGVFAAANHVATFCKHVEVVTMLGSDHEEYAALIRNSLKPNVTLTPIIRPDAPTTRKQRFVDPGYMRKLFEVYYMNDEPLASSTETQINQAVMKRIRDYDVVIVTDFGHSMIGGSTVEILANQARFLAVNTQSNSANMGYNLIQKYPRADYVCIDTPEARLATGERFKPIQDVISTLMPMKIDCPKFIITHGRNGCVTHERDGAIHQIPALTNSVVDTVGAGDAFLSITAPLVASGASLQTVGFIGNVAGALKVGIIGHQRSVEKPAVVKSLTALLK
jgi:rfaE bifunctional protein nucleotidyltransferase chain/domain